MTQQLTFSSPLPFPSVIKAANNNILATYLWHQVPSFTLPDITQKKTAKPRWRLTYFFLLCLSKLPPQQSLHTFQASTCLTTQSSQIQILLSCSLSQSWEASFVLLADGQHHQSWTGLWLGTQRRALATVRLWEDSFFLPQWKRQGLQFSLFSTFWQLTKISSQLWTIFSFFKQVPLTIAMPSSR